MQSELLRLFLELPIRQGERRFQEPAEHPSSLFQQATTLECFGTIFPYFFATLGMHLFPIVLGEGMRMKKTQRLVQLGWVVLYPDPDDASILLIPFTNKVSSKYSSANRPSSVEHSFRPLLFRSNHPKKILKKPHNLSSGVLFSRCEDSRKRLLLLLLKAFFSKEKNCATVLRGGGWMRNIHGNKSSM